MKKKISQYIYILAAIVLVLVSCVSHKKIAYFQKAPNESDTISLAKTYVPTIQTGDILSVYVNSLNSASSSFFNPFTATSGTGEGGASGSVSGSQGGIPSSMASSGFLVNASGSIEFPIVGLIKVQGLTTMAAADTIKNRLRFYLKSPTVNVRFLNYKISVMGEVAHPSVYIIPNERVTIPEALSVAGDLTVFARRDNILIVRDVDGKKQFGRVNLTTRELFSSPYYYLHSGDIIYVEQGKGRIIQSDEAFRIIPLVISAISVMVLIIYRFGK